MRSFRLYLGERRYLTAAGWLSLAVTIAATAAIGYFGAAPLMGLVGGDALWVVAGCGVGVWLAAQWLFRLAGWPLVVEVRDQPRRRQ